MVENEFTPRLLQNVSETVQLAALENLDPRVHLNVLKNYNHMLDAMTAFSRLYEVFDNRGATREMMSRVRHFVSEVTSVSEAVTRHRALVERAYDLGVVEQSRRHDEINMRLTKTMYWVAGLSAVALPTSLVTGFWGMNFGFFERSRKFLGIDEWRWLGASAGFVLLVAATFLGLLFRSYRKNVMHAEPRRHTMSLSKEAEALAAIPSTSKMMESRKPPHGA